MVSILPDNRFWNADVSWFTADPDRIHSSLQHAGRPKRYADPNRDFATLTDADCFLYTYGDSDRLDYAFHYTIAHDDDDSQRNFAAHRDANGFSHAPADRFLRIR